MSNLEHNIKEAFAAQDTKIKLDDKDGMWNRLDNKMGRRLGVAAFWRVAAILLGVFILTGVFASINIWKKQQANIKNVGQENRSLLTTIDSLNSVSAATITEIQIVEREKVVYRDRTVIQKHANSEEYWKKEYNMLVDSTELVFASNKKQVQEITILNEELTQTKQELLKRVQDLTTETEKKPAAPFELKSEQVEVEISKTPAVKTPEMKMKVFQKNFIENRNNLNSTIFKQ